MAKHKDLEPKAKNYDDVPPMVTLRWLLERRHAELLDQVNHFAKEMEKVLIDDEQRATFGILGLAAQAAADEIKDALMPLFGQFLNIDMPISADMAIYYVDILSEDTAPGAWGPLYAKAGDVVVHLKAQEENDDGVDLGDPH